MSDPFFQKKRKRTTSQSASGGSQGDGRRNSRRDGPAAGAASKGEGRRGGMAKPGPSRLRMREKGKRGAELGEDEQGEKVIGNDVDDDDDDDDGGIEAMDLAHRYDKELRESDEDEQETPAEARVRLAKMYLDSLKDDDVDANDVDAAEIDRKNISSRLQADAATHSTHIHDFVADSLDQTFTTRMSMQRSNEGILACRGHRLSVTTAIVAPDCSSLWTAAKDGRIVRWRLRDGKMLEMIGKSALLDEGAGKGAQQKQSTSSGAARRRARAQAALTTTTADARADNAMTNGHHDAATNGVEAADDVATDNSEDAIMQGYTREHIHLSKPSAGQGHTGEVWALTASQDGKYLVSGGNDRRICVWEVLSPRGDGKGKQGEHARSTFVKALGGHKDSITGLRFRHGTHDLFSASLDRTLKLFDVSQLSYVETFFGHQEDVAGLDVLRGEVAVSAGSRDRTVRWWKVREESQLVFRGGAKSRVREVLEGGDLIDNDDDGGRGAGSTRERAQLVEGSIDAVAMVDEHTFLSGGDTGTLCLWSLAKKKPIFSVAAAHGFHTTPAASTETARWITSLACLPYGDVFASGSWDGKVRLWKLASNLKSFEPLCTIPAPGFVNSLQLVHPTRSIIKRRGGQLVEPALWRRRGGLRGGVKKIFDEPYDVNDGENGRDNAMGAGDEQQDVDTNVGTRASAASLLLVAAIGQEPVRGRWLRIKEARNGTLVVPIPFRA